MSETNERLNYRKTLLLGFGFMASSLAWALYNAQVPLMLKDVYGFDKDHAGIIMGLDNLVGLVLLPLLGAWSDRSFTRIGRRMPWIVIGIPLSALLFALIPWFGSLGATIGILIAFILAMSLWRTPVIALMPDLTPRPLRSKANGLINLMGGIGGILAFTIGMIVVSTGTRRVAFGTGSIFMLIAFACLVLFIREPAAAVWRKHIDGGGDRNRSQFAKIFIAEDKLIDKAAAGEEDRALTSEEKRSLILILSAIFFWFCAYNAIETFFTTFAQETLKVPAGIETGLLNAFLLPFIAFALPAGLIGYKKGRKKTIVAGLLVLIAAMMPIIFVDKIFAQFGMQMGDKSSFLGTMILVVGSLVVAGCGWACVNINSLPMIVELATLSKIGRYTGFYYTFSFSAQTITPWFAGLLMEKIDNRMLFIYSAVCFAAALLCMLFVKRGDVHRHSKEVMEEALLDLD
ncbi:MAG: MFS transporter [Saccharofermentanales bacterium]